MKKTTKKLALHRESILRLDRSALREVMGGVSNRCTATFNCTDSCQVGCESTTCVCGP